MPISKFEKKSLGQIDQLNEGLGLSLLKFFFKGKVRKALKTMADDPEVISAIQGIEYHEKELEKQAKDFEKKYGKHPRGENRVKPKF